MENIHRNNKMLAENRKLGKYVELSLKIIIVILIQDMIYKKGRLKIWGRNIERIIRLILIYKQLM